MALRGPELRGVGARGSEARSPGFQNSETAAELKRGVLFFSAMRSYLLSAGFIGGMIGTITILANLSDTAHVGFGAALVLLTILYALVLSALVVQPLRTSLEKQLAGVQLAGEKAQEAG